MRELRGHPYGPAAGGVQLWLLPQRIVDNATAVDNGLVDVHGACDGLCVQQSYDAYIEAPRTSNAKEAVAGFF